MGKYLGTVGADKVCARVGGIPFAVGGIDSNIVYHLRFKQVVAEACTVVTRHNGPAYTKSGSADTFTRVVDNKSTGMQTEPHLAVVVFYRTRHMAGTYGIAILVGITLEI